MTVRYLAVDAGQSGLRGRVWESKDLEPLPGPEPGAYASNPDLSRHLGIRTDLPLAEQIIATITALSAEFGSIDFVAMGITGYTGTEDLTGLGVLTPLGVRGLLFAHDSTTSFLGALGMDQGVVVAAGTGVVTLAVGEAAVARVDGWGNIMGDAGSGYWFGAAALTAAMRAHDGRGPKSLLLNYLNDEFADIESAYIQLQSDPSKIRRVASFSRWVTTAEREGDAVASAICRQGARELALSASIALDRVGISRDADSPVCTIGGLFQAETIARHFVTELTTARPNAQYFSARGTSLNGAADLFALPPSHPLNSRVTRIDLTTEVRNQRS